MEFKRAGTREEEEEKEEEEGEEDEEKEEEEERRGRRRMKRGSIGRGGEGRLQVLTRDKLHVHPDTMTSYRNNLWVIMQIQWKYGG